MTELMTELMPGGRPLDFAEFPAKLSVAPVGLENVVGKLSCHVTRRENLGLFDAVLHGEVPWQVAFTTSARSFPCSIVGFDLLPRRQVSCHVTIDSERTATTALSRFCALLRPNSAESER